MRRFHFNYKKKYKRQTIHPYVKTKQKPYSLVPTILDTSISNIVKKLEISKAVGAFYIEKMVRIVIV